MQDATRDDRFAHDQHLQETSPQSVLCIPLIYQGRLRSILYLENSLTKGAFTPDRVGVLSWLSAQMAIAIDNARLYQGLEAEVAARTAELRAERDRAEEAQRDAVAAKQEAERRRQEADLRRRTAEGLRDVLAIINSDRPLEEVLDYLVQEACRLLGGEAAVIYRVPSAPASVHVQGTFGMARQPILPSYMRVDPDTLRTMLLTHDALGIADMAAFLAPPAAADATSDENADFVIPVEALFQAVVAVPILVDGELCGGLALYRRGAHQFTEEELELASLLSDQAALAMGNDRLREQVKQASATAERDRLARDLHDAVSQTLFSARLIADSLPGVWEVDPAEGQRGLEDLRQLTRGALAEMRALLVELHPAALTTTPLGALLRQLGEAMSGRVNAQVAVEAREDGAALPPDVQVAFYRIAQEALNNVAKHAHAQHAWIQLCRERGQVVLRVRDDGAGFDPRRTAAAQRLEAMGGSERAGRRRTSAGRGGTSVSPSRDARQGGHLGLDMMRERITSIGASYTLASKPGQGTRLVVRWPEQRPPGDGPQMA